MPRGTSRSTSESATKSPKLRVRCLTWMTASLTRHLHRRRHASAQLVLALVEIDPDREHLVRALVGRLQVARRVLAFGIDVLDRRLERAIERIGRHCDLVANVDVTELRL